MSSNQARMDSREAEDQERSESVSARTNPFTDRDATTSRKRQKTSKSSLRSMSAETMVDLDLTTDSSSSSNKVDVRLSASPQTPPTVSSDQAVEPTSSKVTINLRSRRASQDLSASPESLIKAIGNKEGQRTNVETDVDKISARSGVASPLASLSGSESPRIEVVMMDGETDYNDELPVTIIGDEDEELEDLPEDFPGQRDGETTTQAIARVARYLQYEEIDDADYFRSLSNWLRQHLSKFADTARFCEMYLRDRETWMRIPELFHALNRRSRFFGSFLHHNEEDRQALTDMYEQFARVTGRLLTVDVMILENSSNQASRDFYPDLVSASYLRMYAFLVRSEEFSHIGHNLNTHYTWNWDADVLILRRAFESEHGTLATLSRLVVAQSQYLSRNPKLAESFTDPCRIAAGIVVDSANVLRNAVYRRATNLRAKQLLKDGFSFLNDMIPIFEVVLKQYGASISADSITIHLASLTTIYLHSLIKDNPSSKEVLDRFHEEHPHVIPTSQHTQAVVYSWKLSVLYKLITSSQMQFRIHGVTTMCNDLLHIFSEDKDRMNASENSLLLYVANLLLQLDILDQIMGVNSHPEIIAESINIVGFLIVTKTYTKKHTDMIWHTIMCGQDPRVVSATLRALQRLLQYYELSQLYYLCNKAKEAPIHHFTPAMREFCGRLIEEIVKKKQAEREEELLSEPYDLCIRLLRESLRPDGNGTVSHFELSAFAIPRLHNLFQFGPTETSRREIGASCLEDLASASSTSWGSICLVNLLIRQYPMELPYLVANHNFTQLMVEKLEESNFRRRGSTASVNSPDYDLSAACLEALMLVIVNQPEKIGADIGKRIWLALVGDPSTPTGQRHNAWALLNDALKKSRRNQFLRSCFQLYLSDLPAECFETGTLEFAKQMIEVWLEDVDEGDYQDGPFESLLALEQLWRIILLAPQNTIENPAIRVLVAVYIDSNFILKMPHTTARTVHQTLIYRCLNQMQEAASMLQKSQSTFLTGEPVTMIEDNIRDEAMFTRSLAVLQEFLRCHRKKPQFAVPKMISFAKSPTTNPQDEQITVKYQSFDGNTNTEVKTIQLGRLSTAASLLAGLQEATGFKNYKVYYRGKSFDPAEIDVCQSLGDMNLGTDSGLLLIQRKDLSNHVISLDTEIINRLPDLWQYLGMHGKVAQETYHLLIKLPVYGLVTDLLHDEAIPYSQVFPTDQPFKSLYATHVLKHVVLDKKPEQPHSEAFLNRAMSLVTSAINAESNPASQVDEVHARLTVSLTEFLVQFLRESDLSSAAHPLFDIAFADNLLRLISKWQPVDVFPNVVSELICRVFDVMLEVSCHSPQCWIHLSTHLEGSNMIGALILTDDRTFVRNNISKQIMHRCSSTFQTAQVSSTFLATFWPLVVGLITNVADQPEKCEDVYTLALGLFKELDAEGDVISTLITQWSKLLLRSAQTKHFTHRQYDSPDELDSVALGLANLIHTAVMSAKLSRKVLSCGRVGVKLFSEILFPRLLDEEELELNPLPYIPILHSGTRERLLEAAYFLVRDEEQCYDEIVHHLADLLPHSVSDDSTYAYELSWGFDRSDAIRSGAGYVGLRNLSNTCYLNSLCTQLFMNVPFRQFILELDLGGGGYQQQLLIETQALFSHMQNSLSRYVDPQRMTDSIQTYDLSRIDVTVQMDVDEFYNLIFDRWEAQLTQAGLQKKFKSFYGGQLVHQVKSKECMHISEREESFSAIQCEIKGKTCLQESLQAYVEGEVMEGDNKYKCSDCNRHVDAVKRARLKEIPDSLIFHLKRFDFNLRTLQRSKINDYFSFPDVIDMHPYTVSFAEGNPDDVQDLFELVGVLVHSGTAESGHYYSYTRERPSSKKHHTWVEFNDEIVSSWDFGSLETCCFGGPDLRPDSDSGFDKSYSAYMLFYQRTTSLAVQQTQLMVQTPNSPLQVPIHNKLASIIAIENELTLRKYCLYEPAQALLMSRMLNNMRKFNNGVCTSSHNREKDVLHVSLHFLDQVVARAKDLPHFAAYLSAINRICQGCAECSRDYIDWYTGYGDALRMLLLRNPDAAVRSEISNSALAALKKVKADATYAYGFEDDADSMEAAPQVILHFVDGLTQLYDTFHMNTRAWPEYFGLLNDIAHLGRLEAIVLLDRDFLRKILFIVCADPLLPMDPQYQKMWSNITKRMATRPVSYEAIISLLCRLLESCDNSLDPVANTGNRLVGALEGGPIALTRGERHLLVQQWTRTQSNILVEKLLQIDHNDFAVQRILQWLLKWSAETGEMVEESIYRAIVGGLQRSSTNLSPKSALRAAFTYCEHAEATDAVRKTIEEVSRAAQMDNAAGIEYVEFLKDVLDLAEKNGNVTQYEIMHATVDNVGIWAPNLLTSYEASVRAMTETMVRELILDRQDEIAFEDDRDKGAQMVVQSARNLATSCLDFIQETYLRQGVAVVQASLLNIQVVLHECSVYFVEEDQFHVRHDAMMEALKKCVVEDLEEETSGWEASDYPSSEGELDAGA